MEIINELLNRAEIVAVLFLIAIFLAFIAIRLSIRK